MNVADVNSPQKYESFQQYRQQNLEKLEDVKLQIWMLKSMLTTMVNKWSDTHLKLKKYILIKINYFF